MSYDNSDVDDNDNIMAQYGDNFNNILRLNDLCDKIGIICLRHLKWINSHFYLNSIPMSLESVCASHKDNLS